MGVSRSMHPRLGPRDGQVHRLALAWYDTNAALTIQGSWLACRSWPVTKRNCDCISTPHVTKGRPHINNSQQLLSTPNKASSVKKYFYALAGFT